MDSSTRRAPCSTKVGMIVPETEKFALPLPTICNPRSIPPIKAKIKIRENESEQV